MGNFSRGVMEYSAQLIAPERNSTDEPIIPKKPENIMRTEARAQRKIDPITMVRAFDVYSCGDIYFFN